MLSVVVFSIVDTGMAVVINLMFNKAKAWCKTTSVICHAALATEHCKDKTVIFVAR